MKIKKGFLVTFSLLSLITLSGYENIHKKNSDGKITKKEKVIELLGSIETGSKDPVRYINSQKYIQHNLSVADGLSGFGTAMKALNGTGKAKVIRAFQDGEFVFTHTKYNFFGAKVGFDVFRFENEKIVEHWDNLSEEKDVNPSGHTQIDGETKITDLDKTEFNKKLIKSFIEDVLMGKNPNKITDYISTSKYTQHNTGIGDGIDGLGKAIESMAKAGLVMTYIKNHKILGEGNFVLSMSEGLFAGKNVSFYDLFRIDNGKIVEHWDTIEEIPTKEKWLNNNGKF